MADRPKIGPTEKFSFGQPIDSTDRGGLYVGFACLKNLRHCTLEFGTLLTYVRLPPQEAMQMAEIFRGRVIETWGELSYDKTTLPLRVSVINNLIEIEFPAQVEVLACNPEVILALCEVIEDRLREHHLTGKFH